MRGIAISLDGNSRTKCTTEAETFMMGAKMPARTVAPIHAAAPPTRRMTPCATASITTNCRW